MFHKVMTYKQDHMIHHTVTKWQMANLCEEKNGTLLLSFSIDKLTNDNSTLVS